MNILKRGLLHLSLQAYRNYIHDRSTHRMKLIVKNSYIQKKEDEMNKDIKVLSK